MSLPVPVIPDAGSLVAGAGFCLCGCGKKTALAPSSDVNKGWTRGQPKRYLKGHHSQRPETVVRRFWERVHKKGPDECWPWAQAVSSTGYGQFQLFHHRVLAHRFAYEMAYGAIPSGLQIDHLCRNRACCNPTHLEAVTLRENVLRGVGVTAVNARKTHCVNGHEFNEENTGYTPTGKRVCRACKRAEFHRRRQASRR